LRGKKRGERKKKRGRGGEKEVGEEK